MERDGELFCECDAKDCPTPPDLEFDWNYSVTVGFPCLAEAEDFAMRVQDGNLEGYVTFSATDPFEPDDAVDRLAQAYAAGERPGEYDDYWILFGGTRVNKPAGYKSPGRRCEKCNGEIIDYAAGDTLCAWCDPKPDLPNDGETSLIDAVRAALYREGVIDPRAAVLAVAVWLNGRSLGGGDATSVLLAEINPEPEIVIPEPLFSTAASLLSGDGENPEYDRAITELVCDLIGTDDKEGVLAALKKGTP